MANVNILKVVPPMLLSHHRAKRKREEEKHGVAISLKLRQWIQEIFRTRWFGWTILKNYKQNFPENPRNNRKSQSPNLSVCVRGSQKRRSILSSAALTTVWEIQRVEERTGEEEKEGKRCEGNLYFCYVAEFSYFLSSWLALRWEWIYMSNTEDWRKLRARTDSNGLVRMNPAGLSGPARFPQTLWAVFSRNGWAENFRQPNCVA